MRSPLGGHPADTRRGHDDVVRVAIVTDSVTDPTDDTTDTVLRVAAELGALGHRALVVCARAAGGAVDARAPVPVHRVHPRALRATLARFEPDVVHATSAFGLGARALREARALGIPSVAVHDTDVPAYLAHRAGVLGVGASGPAWRWVRRVLSPADRTLVPSWSMSAELAGHGVPQVAVWGRGVDMALFGPWRRDGGRAAALRESLVPDGEVLVGHVGRLSPEQDLGRLEEVVRVPGTRLVVLGDGPSRLELAVRLTEAAADVRGRPNRPPVLLGATSPQARADACAALDVFVHPGARGTFARTVQEAAASAVPVVATARGAAAELVGHGRTGLLVDPTRLGGFAEAVAALAADPGLRARLGRAGRVRAAGRTWTALTRELVAHYDAVRTGTAAAA